MGVIVAWPVLMVCVVLIVGGVMVKQEHDREDLLRDGKQMTARAEAVMDDVVVVIGFRPNSQVSFYFGQDPVFQFNTARELRRVFHQGRSYAAIEGKLCELTRQRQGGRLTLVSQVIPANLEEMIFEVRQRENRGTLAQRFTTNGFALIVVVAALYGLHLSITAFGIS